MSDSLWHHELQHFRFPCPSPPSWVCSNSCPLIYQFKSRQRKPTNMCKNSQLTRRPMVLNSGLSTCWISYSWEIIFLFYLIYQMSFFCSKTLAQTWYFILSVPTWHFHGHKRLDILLSLTEINILILPFSDKSTVTSVFLSIVEKLISTSMELVQNAGKKKKNIVKGE